MASTAFRTLQLKQFHELFLSKDQRADGRSFEQFRDILLTANTIDTADGSCLVKLGNTTVVAGIAATLVEPSSDGPSLGLLELIVELPPICCNQKFRENKQGTNDESQIAGWKLEKAIKESSCFDLSQLVVSEGNLVWSLKLQVICLDYDGNFGDAALIAAIGALNCGSLPEVRIPTTDDTSRPVSDQVKFLDERRMFKLSSVPVDSTFAVFEHHVLSDPTFEEESLASGLVTITWDTKSGSLIGVDKGGGAGLTEDKFESLFQMSKARSGQVIALLKRNNL